MNILELILIILILLFLFLNFTHLYLDLKLYSDSFFVEDFKDRLNMRVRDSLNTAGIFFIFVLIGALAKESTVLFYSSLVVVQNLIFYVIYKIKLKKI